MRGRIHVRQARAPAAISAYAPLELVELELCTGAAGLGADGAGLELGAVAGAGETGFGVAI
jgi:hypothetical protein